MKKRSGKKVKDGSGLISLALENSFKDNLKNKV